MRYIPGEGPVGAQLLILGEAPGRYEEEVGRPFQGPAGHLLDSWLESNGISRDECYLTNVVKYQPPDSQFKRLEEIHIDLQKSTEELWQEIKIINPNCILSLGENALHAVTSCKGISKWRGSILNSINGYPKVVPTFHPAAFLYSSTDDSTGGAKYAYIHIAKHIDIPRAIEESKTKSIDLPKRHLWYAENAFQVMGYLSRNRGKGRVSIDVETYKQGITCVGLAFNNYEAVSIPLVRTLSGLTVSKITDTDLCIIWRALDELFRDESIEKIGQNFKFDQEKLEEIGFRVFGQVHDLMLMGHTIQPEYPSKALQFWCSIYTREPYYKDEYAEYDPRKHDIARVLLYNAKDAVVTFDVFEKMYEELQEDERVYNFYQRFVSQLHTFYRQIERIGFVLNTSAQKELSEGYAELIEKAEKELEEIAGHSVNLQSPKQIGQLLYEQFKIPRRKSTDEDTLIALLANTVKNDVHRNCIKTILETRRLKKAKGTYIDIRPDYDGLIRTSYNIIGTETGRSSTSKPDKPLRPCPMGLALQTLTKRGIDKALGRSDLNVRRMLEPHAGKYIVELDYSQAEARIVALLADDATLLRLFDLIDIHKLTASWCFDKKMAEFDLQTVLKMAEERDPRCLMPDVSKEERFIGKSVRHGGNYDEGKHTLMTTLMTEARNAGMEDFHISEWKCGEILKTFHLFSPNIRSVFHTAIRDIAFGNRVIYNPFGRRRLALGRDDKILKELFAHIPQSTVPDALRFAALRAKERNPEISYCMEWHDALYLSAPKEIWKEQTRVVLEEMERPIDFSQCSISRGSLVIPGEVKVYKENWAISEDVKKASLVDFQ
jgi:uracil-DNA glycosylase family 4